MQKTKQNKNHKQQTKPKTKKTKQNKTKKKHLKKKKKSGECAMQNDYHYNWLFWSVSSDGNWFAAYLQDPQPYQDCYSHVRHFGSFFVTKLLKIWLIH